MNKRKKTQISEENQELNTSKAKKTLKRKTQWARERDLEKPVEVSDSSNTLSKATVVEVVQECQEHGLDSPEIKTLATDLVICSAEESKKTSSEQKVPAKGFLPPSQEGRLVPVVAKTKNQFPERCEGNNGDAPGIQIKQDVLESSEAECMVRNEPCDVAGKAVLSIAPPSVSPELMDLLVTEKEGTRDQGILHCEERLDVKMQNQDRTISINNGNAVPELIDAHQEAHKSTSMQASISEKQIMKSKKRVSFFLCNKDAKSFEERQLSTGYLDHVKSDQNEEMPKGPVLQTKKGAKNRREKLVPIIKQSKFDICDLRPNEISETLSNRDTDQQNWTQIPEAEIKTSNSPSSLFCMDGKQETVMCEEKESAFCVEDCLSSAGAIPQLQGVVEKCDSSRENPGSEVQGSFLSTGTGSSVSEQSSADAVAQTCSPLEDHLSEDLEFLLDSPLQGVFENHSLELPPKKLFSLDDPCAASGQKSIVNVAHPNNAGDETMVRNGGPSKEEDATDVVRGLIKELSNLNRLVMSTHRDLDSFKRLKFRRYRQSGKLLPHSMNTLTNMQCAVKKKKRMSLVNTITNFNICKDFPCSSDISSAVRSKAVIMNDKEADV